MSSAVMGVFLSADVVHVARLRAPELMNDAQWLAIALVGVFVFLTIAVGARERFKNELIAIIFGLSTPSLLLALLRFFAQSGGS